ncbi:uncharacterized protein [Pyxicephalus adspersus]|uniref:uncharacterized protein n=1 Tax=Pyxicephalus adspersus TaxID=30357 RepID=UPI003B5C30FA
MYPWLQSLVFFYAIICAGGHRKPPLSNDLLNFQTVQEKSLNLLQSSSVKQIPLSKLLVVSDVLSSYQVPDQYRYLIDREWPKSRLLKRDVENKNGLITALKLQKAVREVLAEKESSAQSEMLDFWSRVSKRIGLPSQVNVRSTGSGGTSTMQSATSLPFRTTHTFHYENTKNSEKLETYTEGTTSSASSNTSNFKRLTSINSQSLVTQKPSNSTAKGNFTVAASREFKSSTLGNIMTSNFKTSAGKRSSSKISTDSGLVNHGATMATNLFSSVRETSSQFKHSILQNDHTSSTIFSAASLYTKLSLSPSTSDIPRLSVFPSTKEASRNTVTFTSNNKFSDQVTSTKEKLVQFSQVENTSVNAFISSLMPIKSVYPVTQISFSHKSTGTGTSESAGNVESASTERTFLSPTLYPKLSSSTEKSIESTEAVSFETDYEMLSSITPLPISGSQYPACELKVRNVTTTLQTPLTKQTVDENIKSVDSFREKTLLNPKNETELPSTMAVSAFADSYTTEPKEESSFASPSFLLEEYSSEPTELDTSDLSVSHEPTEFPSSTTLYLSDSIFHDVFDRNVNSNHMASSMSSTSSSTGLPFWLSKSEPSTIPSLISASTKQYNGISKPSVTTDTIKKLSGTNINHQPDPAATTEKPISTSLGEKTLQTKSTPGAMQIMDSMRPTESLRPFSIDKYSSVTPSITSLPARTTLRTKRNVTFQTAVSYQESKISTLRPKSSFFYSLTPITPQDQGTLSTDHEKPTISRSIASTFTLDPLLTISQSRNKTTISSETFDRTSERTSKMSSTKIWIRHSSVDNPLTSTSFIGTERSAALQTASNWEGLNSTIPSKSRILYSTSYLSPQSQVSRSRNKTAISSTSTSGSTSQTYSKIWHPQSSVASLNSTIFVTQRGPRRLTLSKRPNYSISTTTLKSKIFNSSTQIPQRSQTIPTRVRSTLTRSVTSTLKPALTVSQPRTKITTYTSSTKTIGKTLEVPGLKIWMPPSDIIPTKSTTSTSTMSRGLLDIQTTHQSMPSSKPDVVAVPLAFHLTGVSYSEQLSNRTTDEYKRLEREVKLVLNKVLATKYQQEYVQAEILGFSNGSVVVDSRIVFGSRSSTPSGSDIVRTILSDNSATKQNVFGWNINTSTVECQGYSPRNLEHESLSIYFVVLHFGFIAISPNYQDTQNYLEGLQKEMLRTINVSFPITNISFSKIRDLHGDLEVKGILYMQSRTFTDVQVLLSTLIPLANGSVDLRSIAVDGMHNELQIYPFNFRITNEQFKVTLLDMASPESQKLSMDLSKSIELALRDSNLLQVVVREFYSGSVVCKGDLMYRFPAPGSREVLKQFLQARTSEDMLGSSNFKVDFQSVNIGDSTSSPYNEYLDFPGYAVAIIVMCGLCILIFPILVYVCYKTRMLGHRNKATIRQPHDPDQQGHHFEMDNQAFRASIEQP